MDDGFLEQPYRLAMGLRALDLADWLEIGPDRAQQMAERRRLLAARPAEVVAALPESASGQHELFALVQDHLPDRFPELWRRCGEALVHRESGERFAHEQPPLASLGRMVQEDFCLMQQSPTGYRLVAAVLCFPTHWRLAEKLGRPLEAIHAPVPGFAERLAGPVDRFFATIQIERPVWRINWSLVDSPELFRPRRAMPCRPAPPPSHPQGTIAMGGREGERAGAGEALARPGEQLWLRVERQTLRRLPRCGDVVFGIRTIVEPLALVTATPATARALAARVRELPPAMAAYKGIATIREPLLAYLAQRGAAISAS